MNHMHSGCGGGILLLHSPGSLLALSQRKLLCLGYFPSDTRRKMIDFLYSIWGEKKKIHHSYVIGKGGVFFHIWNMEEPSLLVETDPIQMLLDIENKVTVQLL